MYPRQLTTVEQAVAQIKDGAILSFNGIGMIGLAERFFPAMEQRFQCGGHPNSLTLYSACGLEEKPRNLLFAHPGMVSCIIVGYIFPYAVFAPAIKANKIEGYNLPQGIISTNYREAQRAARLLLQIGLHTFAVPDRRDAL